MCKNLDSSLFGLNLYAPKRYMMNRVSYILRFIVFYVPATPQKVLNICFYGVIWCRTSCLKLILTDKILLNKDYMQFSKETNMLKPST